MPSAIPADAVAHLPPAAHIDPRGHRFGAGVSAALLAAAFLLDARWAVGLVFLSIGVSAAFGLRHSIYGAVWRRLVRVMRLGPAEPEHEYPPRFAQTLGSLALIVALIAFVVGAGPVGWFFALSVAGLQALLAVTGYCLGCRLYFLRWWVPAAVTTIWTRGRGKTADGAFGGSISFR